MYQHSCIPYVFNNSFMYITLCIYCTLGSWAWKATDKFNENGGDVWARHFAALEEYGKQYDTCNIPQKDTFKCDLINMAPGGGIYHYDGALGKWLDNQRRKAHQGQMHKEREAKLQGLADQGMLMFMLRLCLYLVLLRYICVCLNVTQLRDRILLILRVKY